MRMLDLSKTPLAQLSLQEDARPKMPPIAGATDVDRRKGKHLAAIHRHYLSEMAQIEQVLERIKAGDEPPEALSQIVLHSDMRKNFEVVGTICGHQCRVLTMHHNIEEHSMFPALAAKGNSALTAVVEKLRAEHLIVHELLKRLEAAGSTLTQTSSDAHFRDATEVFFKLRRVVISHFGYEETELEEAIGLYLDGL